ncbi:bifunctional hydroxymethylpyrimidine kinase/phosphomethylpyrimidine kinase [Candidatus Desantisbacteria bacterium]|nr:bifunctional hydroxymethylpyrimidine kinase/phosphomethylpyrimidine kinase [Candidatus Desantisbacteria bacterium]
MKNVLTIAGYDPSGGAGIQADLKTFSALETNGLSVSTALTVQNSRGVFSTAEIDEDIISKQLNTLATDIDIHAIKIGMLYKESVIKVVVSFLEKKACPIVVLDPILISKNGFWLLKESAISFLIKHLFPLATIVTPNIKEAQMLCHFEIKNDNDIRKSASIMKGYGPKYVLIKGSSVTPDTVTDLLYNGHNFMSFETTNMNVHPYLHGTGCAFASAITAYMVKGFDIHESIKKAQSYLRLISLSPIELGKGNYYLNHLGILQRDAEKYAIISELKSAFLKLSQGRIAELIPEVQSNMVFAMNKAVSIDEIAGFPGRIAKIDDSIAYVAVPEFGKSRHMASMILAVMHYFPHCRSAINIKFSKRIIEICEKLGYTIYSFDRKDEPEEDKNKDGKTLDWGVNQALAKVQKAPDVIYDTGAHGKEPMVRVIGQNPSDVTEKIISIKNAISNDSNNN